MKLKKKTTNKLYDSNKKDLNKTLNKNKKL